MTFCGNSLLRSLLGVKRTCHFALHMSASDPKRTCLTMMLGHMIGHDLPAHEKRQFVRLIFFLIGGEGGIRNRCTDRDSLNCRVGTSLQKP